MSKAKKLIEILDTSPILENQNQFYKEVSMPGMSFGIHANFYPQHGRILEVYFTVSGQSGMAAIHADKILRNKMTIGRILTEMLYFVPNVVKKIGRDNISEIQFKDEMPNQYERERAFTALQHRVAKAVYAHQTRPYNKGRGMVYPIDMEL